MGLVGSAIDDETCSIGLSENTDDWNEYCCWQPLVGDAMGWMLDEREKKQDAYADAVWESHPPHDVGEYCPSISPGLCAGQLNLYGE